MTIALTSLAGSPVAGPEPTLARAAARLKSGSIREAEELAAGLVVRNPGYGPAWRLLGQVHARKAALADALHCYERALECDPREPLTALEYARLLLRLGRRREALAVAEGLERQNPLSAAAQDGLGTLLTFADEPRRALPWFERAAAQDPANPAFLYNLATAQRMVGDLEAAERSLDAVIAARPADFAAYHTRADLRTQTRERNHVAQMLPLLASVAESPGRTPLYFALAKELEDLGEYRRSFEFLRQGCDLVRGRVSYDVGTDVATMVKLIETHTAARLGEGPRGFDSEEPIFIVGLPRTGTTLVDRIISAHSQVYSAGELSEFASVLVDEVHRLGPAPTSKQQFAERALQAEPRKLAKAYLAATRPRTGRTPRFTDKQPLNFLYAGLIHRALPKAAIVALERDPMDACYAMYKTLFTSVYPFSYDLTDLGRYYAAWQKLLRHWEATVGERWLTVRYEELVTNPEPVIRRILSHCGLAWEDRCLAFHEQTAAVTTASAVQVRRPIYTASVGAWRRYASELQPLMQALVASGIRRSDD